MKTNYFLLILLAPFLFFAQATPFTGTTVPDLTGYGEATNHVGQAEYQIFKSADDVLDKPIIVIDGFDPGDNRKITGIYDLLNYTDTNSTQNLADLVIADNYDVIILNFPIYTRSADMVEIDGGADFIERNAMLLVDLINIINTEKTVDAEDLVIIGPSMGGLISRYALNYMESESIDHETRLWLSFDSPHYGANVPIGFQHQFNYLANGLADNNILELQPVVNGMLKSAAARQMLVDHFEAHLEDGSVADFDAAKLLPEAHPWRTIFNDNINGLTTSGFPENTRNISIINGSGIGMSYNDKTDNPISPGFSVINSTFNVPDVPVQTNVEIEINFTPDIDSGSQLVSKVRLLLFGFIEIGGSQANSQTQPFSDGVDAASGGLFDIAGLTDGLDTSGLVGDFLGALTTDNFNFIPSVSAMALDNDGEIDWFHTIDLGSPTGKTVQNSTPFVNWYMPDENQPHVQLTEENVAFALAEINQSSLNNNSFDLLDFRI